MFARFSSMRPTRTASAPTWYWSWQREVTCWSISMQCQTSDVAQGWRKKRPEGCSGNWSALWPTATMLALYTGEGAVWPIWISADPLEPSSHIPFSHRDLKCENILLDDQGFIKLTGEPIQLHRSKFNSGLLPPNFCLSQTPVPNND